MEDDNNDIDDDDIIDNDDIDEEDDISDLEKTEISNSKESKY